MPEFIGIPIETDPEDILADAYDYLRNNIPGWEPADGNLDVWLLQSVSSAAAESRDVVSTVPYDIFREFGANFLNVPPLDEVPATVTSTWTMVDTAGYTIPAGTQVAIFSSGGDAIAFETIAPITVPAGLSATAAGGVTLQAVIAGAQGSGLGAPGASLTGGQLELIDTLAYVSNISLTAATAGGQDPESDDDYLSRLVDVLQTLAPRPIVPADFPIFARNAGAWRAVAIDGYNPGTGTYNNEKYVAVAVMDSNGNAMSAPAKAAIDADLQARRETNFVVNVIDPTQVLIDVTYTVAVRSGYLGSSVVAAVNSALTAYLNPATWGNTEESIRDWTNKPTVYYLEIAQVINSVEGVDRITTTGGNYDLTIRINGGSYARTDLALSGVAPVPKANTLLGTAV